MKQKFIHLEQLLFWRGVVNRRDLMLQFSLSESTAASTFREYSKAHPGVLVLNRTKRSYTPIPGFIPAHYKPDIAHCELTTIGSGLRIEVKNGVLAALSQSIRNSMTLEIEYVSIYGAESKREIAPMCLINMVEGFPPALHAWCFLRGQPRTFQTSLIRTAVVKRLAPPEVLASTLEIGTVTFKGIFFELPREAIYAAAGQLIAVPELRDVNALRVISELASQLETEWVKLP